MSQKKMPRMPYIDLLQSITCAPVSDSISIVINLKIIPDNIYEPHPFFGIWLLDLSGSMREEQKCSEAKLSLINQVENLPSGTLFTLISFGNPVVVHLREIEINERNKREIVSAIEDLQPFGSTPLHGGMKETLEILEQYDGVLETKKVILIGDGQPDWGCSREDKRGGKFRGYMKYATRVKNLGASIDSIGVGKEHNVLLMYNFALESTGKYIFASNAQDLKNKTIISTMQATKIQFADPTLLIKPLVPLVGSCTILESFQHKPTIIRVPFEKIGRDWKTWLRAFEADKVYEFMVKLDFVLNPEQIQLKTRIPLVSLDLNLGKSHTNISKQLEIEFTDDASKIRLNQNLLKQFNFLFSEVEEITEFTIRGNAEGTQRIQGDEIQKF